MLQNTMPSLMLRIGPIKTRKNIEILSQEETFPLVMAGYLGRCALLAIFKEDAVIIIYAMFPEIIANTK